MHRAFTLIELLVVVAIMAVMVSVGVVGVNASRGSTRLSGAVRDVMAMVRTARSLALVTQKPVVLTYENVKVGDVQRAKVSMQAEKIFLGGNDSEAVYTLSGEVVREAVEVEEGGEPSGESLEEILAPREIPEEILEGLCLKALDESAELDLPENETRRSKISIFSTADNISRTLTSAAETKSSDANAQAVAEAEPEDLPFRVSFTVNGMANPPHRIWIYKEGSTPDKGVCIRVDRFGEVKCDDFK